MSLIDDMLNAFVQIACNPKSQLNKYLAMDRKVIGCFPYYVPEEIVEAADMVPFGVWGCQGRAISAAKEYFATFYCSLAQLNLEMGLSGVLDGLSGVIVTSLCDTLRPLSQNFKVGVSSLPFIYLAQPQNRRMDCGIEFSLLQYHGIKDKLEEISGVPITNKKLWDAIEVYNNSRAERRRFVKLANLHPEAVTPTQRNAVLKSAYFMTKAEHSWMLSRLNRELDKLSPSTWMGIRIVTSGILADNWNLLRIFENVGMSIAADDVAHESRSFRVDVPNADDPLYALALQFAAQGQDPLLYDPDIKSRPIHVVDLVKDSGAQGVVVLLMQFCDPEEMEYPYLKKELESAGVPSVAIGIDHQMKDFEQARTLMQTFADVLTDKSNRC